MVPTHFWLSILILSALQDMVDYSASGGIGEEGLSVVDSEAGRNIIAHVTVYQYHPVEAL